MPARYLLIAGTFLLSMLLYVDRVCISAAKDAVSSDLAFSDRQMGWVFAAFSLGYALFQTPSGILADRLGPRRVLTAVVCFWSLFTAMTAFARNLASMLAVRFLFGAGEAGAFPGMARAIYSWLPMSERGLAQGINFSASRLGAAFAMPGISWLVLRYGWRTSFVLLGVVGFLWAVAWYFWFRDTPEEHPRVSPDERALILASRQQASDSATKPSYGMMFRSGTMWRLMGQYFASNFTFFFCLTWLLPHLSEKYGLSTGRAGWYAMLPLLAGMVGNWVGGGLVDGIYRKGRWTASRRVPAMLGFGLAGAGLLASLLTDNAVAAVFCLSLAILGADMTLSPSWTTCIDIGRSSAGAVSGTMNMAGNLGAFATSLAFPYLREWGGGSTTPFFVVGAMLNFLAVALWWRIRPECPLLEAG